MYNYTRRKEREGEAAAEFIECQIFEELEISWKLEFDRSWNYTEAGSWKQVGSQIIDKLDVKCLTS